MKQLTTSSADITQECRVMFGVMNRVIVGPLRAEKQERYETSHKTIGRDDSYPVQGRF